MSSKPMLSQEIKALAAEAGFDACGISAAGPVDEGHAAFFRKWLEDGRNADMHYMAGYEDKRLNPALLAAGAKSVISLALNYHQERRIDKRQWQIATYAYGKDYHTVVKSMLHALALKLRDVLGINVLGVYCDTAPVLERYWAWRGGLGWIGRNTQLIIPGKGSNFFLGEILVDVETDYDSPMDSRCGDCMRCVNACPGKALCAAGGLDAGRCLSYLTIEYRGDMSGEQAVKLGNRIYGCDTCQDVCPHNSCAAGTNVEEFVLSPALAGMDKADWLVLTEERYRELFKGSAVKRAKYAGLCRNIKAVSGNDE